MHQDKIQTNSRYEKALPYFTDGKLRKNHLRRILAEKSFFRKNCQDYSIKKPVVLDIGCHDGKVLKIITESFEAKLFGIEALKNVAIRAKKNGIKAVSADIEEGLPFRDSFFDIVIAGEIVEHIYDPDSLLKDINRVLKAKGGVILSVPNICSLRNRLRIMLGRFPHSYNSSAGEKWGDHIRIFTAKSMSASLEKSGFSVKAIASNGLFGSGMAGRVLPRLGDTLVFYGVKK